MREIKFRAWFENRMHNIIGMNLKFKIAHSKYGSIPFKENEGILMQYMNQKDINGKKIFESDIVKLIIRDLRNGYYHEDEYVGVVSFVEGTICVLYLDGDQECQCMLNDASVLFEVLGNIYENAELLEEIWKNIENLD